ncbi:hypothetical protein Bhyg_09338 [Pseudolycoriella hygida]|uniref:Uncharacterized protein n=1 Tax=Pseudolycoriella hygida TaxID=35572 RepID=A0A9Q0S4B6_9DIPT|nr:hypothetical protein Bhyg_09338 [Pseudolycoriella hygida]
MAGTVVIERGMHVSTAFTVTQYIITKAEQSRLSADTKAVEFSLRLDVVANVKYVTDKNQSNLNLDETVYSRIVISLLSNRTTMDIYKLMVVRWSIFTLFIQLIYCASVYSNVDLHTHPAESICKADPKQYIQEREVESSLIYDLHPGDLTLPCRSMLSAPDSNGFIVRLHKPKVRKSYETTYRNSGESEHRSRNATSCPLIINSSNDQLIAPWKIDPCQLEAHGILDEPVRLLPGQLKITWNHFGQIPVYKLMITVLGKGYHCQQKGKHADEVMLCVSDTLVCDGIRHCPNGNEYDSDEDPELCSTHKTNMDFRNNGNIFQHIAKEFRKIYPQEENVSVLTPPPKMTIITSTSIAELDTKKDRPSLTRGLSRYGPWGYLMLGMLVCGGGLLFCGLYECCCRHKKPATPSSDLVANGFSSPDLSSTANSSPVNDQSLPQINYDEIDPPPSYAALFPNQKTTTESNGISSSATQDASPTQDAPPTTLPTNT